MKIYLSGIGGVGIGALAGIAKSAGYQVFGSDLKTSPMSQKLEQKGIEISYGEQDGEFLKRKFIEDGVEWFVYTSALPKDHPELVMAKELGLKITKRDEFLNEIIRQKNLKLIAIAGTHGKTTTTGMAVWAFKQLGIPISWSVGSTLTFAESGFFDPKSQYFIYEADEFDRNFLSFHPEISLITTIDHDHTDIYKTEAEYFAAFEQFARQSDFVMSWHDQNPQIFDEISNKAILRTPDPDLKLPGEHNRRNATLVLEAIDLLASEIGEDLHDSAVRALNDFPGADRRFEKLADGIYSDYGHHPVEILSTLQMASEVATQGFSGVSLIYQPHQNVRQVEVQNNYNEEVFVRAEEVIWLPTFLSRENHNLEILTPEYLSRKISAKTTIMELDENLKNAVMELRKQNRLVILMGAGSIDGWARQNLL